MLIIALLRVFCCNTPLTSPKDQIHATRLSHEISLNAEHPASNWERAQPISFCSDWQGKNPDPDRTTTVRLLWTNQNLYVRFECRYRELNLFHDCDPDGRRDHL